MFFRGRLLSACASLGIVAVLLAGCAGGAPAPAPTSPPKAGAQATTAPATAPTTAATQASPAPANQASPAAAPSGAPIKFGLIDSYSGASAFLAGQIKNGVELAIREANAQGGAAGRPIELVTREDKAQVDEGLRQARNLVNDEKVSVLMQGINSGVAVAVSGYAKEAKVPFIGVFATTKRLTSQGNEYTFRGNFSTIEIGRTMADYAKERGFKKIATIAPDYEYGRQFTEDFEAAMKAADPSAQVVQQNFPKLGETEFSSYITSILGARPDLIVSGLFGSDLVSFIRQGTGFGLFNQTKMFSHGLGDWENLNALKDALPEGIYTTVWYPWWGIELESSKRFEQSYRAAYNEAPGGYAMVGYNAANVMIENIKKAGGVDPAKMTTAINDATIESPVGPAKVRGCDHQTFLPWYAGEIKADNNLPFKRAVRDLKRYETEKLALTCDEVAKLRQAS